MRKGFDSLSGIISSCMRLDALSGAVFIFFNKKHNQVKLLLWEGDGLMVSELGQRLSLDSGTLTPLLKRLEVAGLVSRMRDIADERRVHVHLTPAGRKLKARAAKVPACVLAASQCSIAELLGLTAQVRGLRERLAA